MFCMNFFALFVLAVTASTPEKPKSFTRFWPDKALLNTANSANLTIYEACKQQEQLNVTFYFSNNTGDVGHMYPMAIDDYNVSGIKALNSSDYTPIIPSNDGNTIKAEKYLGLSYSVLAKAHADIGFFFWYVAPSEKVTVNFTVVSKCASEKKPEVLSSVDKNSPGPFLFASSSSLSATFAIVFISLSTLMY